MKLFLCAILFCFFASVACASPDLNNLGMDYNSDSKMTVVFAKEKLVDDTTGLGAAYNFPSHVMQKPPENVSFSLFGYHDTAFWQNIASLTIVYDGKTYTHSCLHSLHGEDRDKDADLVQSKYYESIALPMPFATAQIIFNSQSVAVTSVPDAVNLKLTASQMDRCRDLLASLPTVQAIHPPDLKASAPSLNGLPVTRTITEASGDATLTTTATMLAPNFSLQCLSFVTISGRKIRQPSQALLIAEVGDAPLLENEASIMLNYGDTHLNLTSNVNRTENNYGAKMAVRTYLITYSRFLTICKAKNLSFTVGDLTVPIPQSKMAGLREIARRIQRP